MIAKLDQTRLKIFCLILPPKRHMFVPAKAKPWLGPIFKRRSWWVIENLTQANHNPKKALFWKVGYTSYFQCPLYLWFSEILTYWYFRGFFKIVNFWTVPAGCKRHFWKAKDLGSHQELKPPKNVNKQLLQSGINLGTP